MKQSETPHGMKHRIEELEEEIRLLRGQKAKENTPKTKTPARGHSTDDQYLSFQEIQNLSINCESGSDVSLARRGGSTYMGHGLFLGNKDSCHGPIPMVVKDTEGYYCLVFRREK